MEENQVLDTAQSSNDNNSQPNQAPVPEKVFTRDQLAKIVSAERAKAAESARKEAEDKYNRDILAIQGQQEQKNANVTREVDANTIYQQVQERFNAEMLKQKELAEQEKQKAQMQIVANTYLSKIDQGRAAYSDFDEITKDFDPTAFPQLTYLLAGIDNAADVLYDLAKNPLKIAGLDRLAEKNPRQAHSELVKLAQSIGVNQNAQAAAQNQQTSAPLDRLQPSRVSGSNGKKTIKDLQADPFYRG